MARYLFDPPASPSVPIVGREEVFPVRRVLCVGRNYLAHRREMGGDDRDPPFFFAKPSDAVRPLAKTVPYPPATSDLHHEIELVAAIGRAGFNLNPDQAIDHVYGYAAGVDLTRRDLQAAAKSRGQPWEAAKGFDDSAPVSAIRPWRGPAPAGRIWLSVNGVVRQDALVRDMIWSVGEIVAQASALWRLEPGDIIFTGTPEGVGPIHPGDRLTGGVEGVGTIDFQVAA